MELSPIVDRCRPNLIIAGRDRVGRNLFSSVAARLEIRGGEWLCQRLRLALGDPGDGDGCNLRESVGHYRRRRLLARTSGT